MDSDPTDEIAEGSAFDEPAAVLSDGATFEQERRHVARPGAAVQLDRPANNGRSLVEKEDLGYHLTTDLLKGGGPSGRTQTFAETLSTLHEVQIVIDVGCSETHERGTDGRTGGLDVGGRLARRHVDRNNLRRPVHRRRSFAVWIEWLDHPSESCAFAAADRHLARAAVVADRAPLPISERDTARPWTTAAWCRILMGSSSTG
jgi:hypothetical protein